MGERVVGSIYIHGKENKLKGAERSRRLALLVQPVTSVLPDEIELGQLLLPSGIGGLENWKMIIDQLSRLERGTVTRH